MARSRHNLIYLAVLLAAVLALGAVHGAAACPYGMSGSAPCCDGMDQTAMPQTPAQHALHAHVDYAMAPKRLYGCAASGHCTCGQPLRVMQGLPREIRPAVSSLSPILVWPGSPVAAGRIPPPQGPPEAGVPDPPGRHTYLATLRLRI